MSDENPFAAPKAIDPLVKTTKVVERFYVVSVLKMVPLNLLVLAPVANHP